MSKNHRHTVHTKKLEGEKILRRASVVVVPSDASLTVHAGFRATRAYPSAAPAHTVSCKPNTGRIPGIASRAATSHISVVPGLAKQTSTPFSRRVSRRTCEPVRWVFVGTARDDDMRTVRGVPPETSYS